MRVPTISEKLRIPDVPAGYLPRERLDRLWAGWRDRRLVLVTAGAGFGKTSFLAANARASVDGCLWCCLDERDADLATLRAHLDDALRDPSGRASSDRQEEAADLPRRALADLIGRLQGWTGRVLVLDDVHLVSGSAPVMAFLQELIRYLPPERTLILASREPLPLATMKERSRGAVAALAARDLEFRPAEVAELFRRRFPGAALDGKLGRRIVERTEGWAAGIEILLQALEGPSAEAVERALDRMESAGTGWFEYFAEEVVDRLDPSLREFLARTSVLPTLTPRICDRLLGTRDSGEVLASLARRNLFTLRMAGEESYRYHHLFRACLRARLLRGRPEEEARAHLARAARALAETGAWADALEVAEASGDTDATVRLIERAGEDLLTAGRHESVRRVFERLPAAVFERSPEALFVLGRLHDYGGEWDEAERIYRRALRRRPPPARRVELQSLVAQILSRRGRHKEAIAWCRRALSARRPRNVRTRGRLLILSGVSECELGWLRAGERRLEEARSLYRRGADAAGEARVEYLLAVNVHLPRGELPRAKESARRALAAFRRLRDERRICYSLGVLSFLAAELGDVPEARRLVEEGQRLAEELGQREQQALARLVLGRCEQLEGDARRAREHFEAALDLGRRLGGTDLLVFPRLGSAELHLAAGDREAARADAREALAAARRARDPLAEAQCRVRLGLADWPARRSSARAWWGRAERILRRLGATFELHRLLLYRLEAGAVPSRRLRETLEELLRGVERLGHRSLLLSLERDRAARVLAAALRLRVETGTARALLVQLGELAVPAVEPLLREAEEPVRLLAVEVLAEVGGRQALRGLTRLARAASTASPGRPNAAARAAEEVARAPVVPLRIQALGPLRVWVGDEERSGEAWRSARARRLFRYLLVQRFRWVQRDQLLEALWPAAEPERATANLWQSVRQLRRILEPDLARLRDSRYIRNQDETYRLEPGLGHAYDVAEFESACREGESLASAGSTRAAENRFRRALELYAGDFLADSPYEEFAAAERERLRERMLLAVSRLLDGCASGRRWGEAIPLCRRALADDPYNENLHYHLVQAHVMLGHRNEALAGYRDFETAMVREMGLLPSPRMRALAERVGSLGRAGPRPS